jgi:hypothetical protein
MTTQILSDRPWVNYLYLYLAGTVATLAFAYFAYLGWKDYSVNNGPTAEGRVGNRDFEFVSDGNYKYWIGYSYTVNGEQRFDRQYVSKPFYDAQPKKGEPITVYYSPDDRTMSRVEPENSGLLLLAAGVIGVIGIPLGTLFLAKMYRKGLQAGTVPRLQTT